MKYSFDLTAKGVSGREVMKIGWVIHTLLEAIDRTVKITHGIPEADEFPFEIEIEDIENKMAITVLEVIGSLAESFGGIVVGGFVLQEAGDGQTQH